MLDIETLICESCGNAWERERKRGIKPKLCSDCKSDVQQAAASAPAVGKTRGSERLLDILTSGAELDPEWERKAVYILGQLDDPENVRRRDPNDIGLLEDVQKKLVRQYDFSIGQRRAA